MTTDPPSHIRVRLDATDELTVLTDSGAIPFSKWAASASLASVRILDLDLVPIPHLSSSECACGRPSSTASSTLPKALKPLSALSSLEIVRRWTPHSCAVPPARRVLNLDSTGFSSGAEGEEFKVEPCFPSTAEDDTKTEKGKEAVAVYNGLWEYDEFPRFVVDGALPPRVVLRVMAPGDEDELDADSDHGDQEEAPDTEDGGEEREDAEEDGGEWEDEDEEEDDASQDELDPAEAKIRELMARTKYLPLTAFIASAANSTSCTHFTLVDVEAWDEDEEDVEIKIRAELEKALARAPGKTVDEVVRFVSLHEYRGEVGREMFRLEGENVPPWTEE